MNVCHLLARIARIEHQAKILLNSAFYAVSQQNRTARFHVKIKAVRTPEQISGNG